MNTIGMPELVIVFMIVVMWGLPIAAAVWVLMTLRRIRDAQEGMRATLDSIERKISLG
jgi:hypothetical protein